MRPTWDKYFIDMCDVVATRATCDRKHVGAVVVIDKRPVTTGYNGSIPGEAHCDDPDNFWQCQICGHKTEEEPRFVKGQGYICERDLSCFGYPMKKRHGGHDMEDGHCVRTIHAEVNALTQAARLGISTKGATLYCNTLPCWNCFKTIVAAGVKEVVYKDEYNANQAGRAFETAKNIPGFILRRYSSES